METKHQPTFTVSLRGYDREEVDEYLDSLAEALTRAEEAEERCRRLQNHVGRMNARVRELEERIRTEPPRSGVALGERIALLLRDAEQTATECMANAEAEAARILADAERRRAEAESLVADAAARAEAEAHRIESAARTRAAAAVSEAEARAAARTRQMEQWAEQIISQTRVEASRMQAEDIQSKKALKAEIEALEAHRVKTMRMLAELREALGRAAGIADYGDSSDQGVEEDGEVVSATSEVAGDEVARDEVAGDEVAGDEVEVVGGAVDEGAVDEGAVDEGAVDEGAVDEGAGMEADPSADAHDRRMEGVTMNGAHAQSDDDESTGEIALDERDEVSGPGEAPHGDEQFEQRLEAWISAGGGEVSYRQ